MPIIPLDHPEPLAATIGVMLYPGLDEASRKRARAWTSQYLAKPLDEYYANGHALPEEQLLKIIVDSGVPLGDIERRWRDGLATGEMFHALFALDRSRPELASWHNAVRVVEKVARREGATGSRSYLNSARSEYDGVAHLWAAFCLRGHQFRSDMSVGYEAWHDLQFFLAEAEILRHWREQWRPRDSKTPPPLPPDPWRVPEDWEPPVRHEDWPLSGVVPQDLALPEDLIEGLRRRGRPKERD